MSQQARALQQRVDRLESLLQQALGQGGSGNPSAGGAASSGVPPPPPPPPSAMTTHYGGPMAYYGGGVGNAGGYPYPHPGPPQPHHFDAAGRPSGGTVFVPYYVAASAPAPPPPAQASATTPPLTPTFASHHHHHQQQQPVAAAPPQPPTPISLLGMPVFSPTALAMTPPSTQSSDSSSSVTSTLSPSTIQHRYERLIAVLMCENQRLAQLIPSGRPVQNTGTTLQSAPTAAPVKAEPKPEEKFAAPEKVKPVSEAVNVKKRPRSEATAVPLDVESVLAAQAQNPSTAALPVVVAAVEDTRGLPTYSGFPLGKGTTASQYAALAKASAEDKLREDREFAATGPPVASPGRQAVGRASQPKAPPMLRRSNAPPAADDSPRHGRPAVGGVMGGPTFVVATSRSQPAFVQQGTTTAQAPALDDGQRGVSRKLSNASRSGSRSRAVPNTAGEDVSRATSVGAPSMATTTLTTSRKGGPGGRRGSPEPRHPMRGEDRPRVFITSNIPEDEKQALIQSIERVGQGAYFLESNFDAPPPLGVTHVIVPDRPRSVKALCGLVSGLYIVPKKYVQISEQLGFWADENTTIGVTRCRAFPFSGVTVRVTASDAEFAEKLRRVVMAGGGSLVDDTDGPTASRGTPRGGRGGGSRRDASNGVAAAAAVISIGQGEDVLSYCERFLTIGQE